MENGFNPISAQCQVIIADGLKGTEYREIEIGGEYCQAPKIGAAIADSNFILLPNPLSIAKTVRNAVSASNIVPTKPSTSMHNILQK